MPPAAPPAPPTACQLVRDTTFRVASRSTHVTIDDAAIARVVAAMSDETVVGPGRLPAMSSTPVSYPRFLSHMASYDVASNTCQGIELATPLYVSSAQQS